MRTPPPPKLLGTRTATSLALCGMDSSSLVLTAFPSALARRIRANLMCLVVLVYCDCGSRQLPGVRAQSVDSSFPALHTEGPRAAAPPRLASQCAQTVQSAPSAASTHYSWSPESSTRACRRSPAAIALLCAARATPGRSHMERTHSCWRRAAGVYQQSHRVCASCGVVSMIAQSHVGGWSTIEHAPAAEGVLRLGPELKTVRGAGGSETPGPVRACHRLAHGARVDSLHPAVLPNVAGVSRVDGNDLLVCYSRFVPRIDVCANRLAI